MIARPAIIASSGSRLRVDDFELAAEAEADAVLVALDAQPEHVLEVQAQLAVLVSKIEVAVLAYA